MNTAKTCVELRCSRMVGNSCFTSGTRRVTTSFVLFFACIFNYLFIVSDLRQIGGFLLEHWCPLPIILTATK
jgi:hypothetical protein